MKVQWVTIIIIESLFYIIRSINLWAKYFRSSPSEAFFRNSFLRICIKFIGEYWFRGVISIKLLCNFIEIAIWYGCSLVNLLHIFRTLFYKNTSEGLLLIFGDFQVLAQLSSTARATELDYYNQKLYIGVISQVSDQLKS